MTHRQILGSGLFSVFCWLSGNVGAATLTVVPSALTNTTTTPFLLEVGGLTPNQTFRVDQYRDLNGNGNIDATEPLVLSFQITEGVIPFFGGVRNTDRPGDEDATTNGQATVALSLSQLAELNQVAGRYAFRISALTGSFTPVVQSFEILPAAFAQNVSGTIRSAGTNLASAMVALLALEDDDVRFVAGTMADQSGHFELAAAPGEYVVLAIKNGYVIGFEDLTHVQLTAGNSVTQDVEMVMTDRTIAGRVFDAINTNELAGLQLFVMSEQGYITMLTTDGTGAFEVSVLADQWEIETSERGLRFLGYGENRTFVDASAGGVTNVQIGLTRARGHFELVFFLPRGGFGSGTNGVTTFPSGLDYYYALYNVEDINLPTNVFFSGPIGSGLTGQASAVFGANFNSDSAFYSSPQITAYPPAGIYEVNYKDESMQFPVADPQAQTRQVVMPPTAIVDPANTLTELIWSYRDASGNVIAAPPFMTEVQIRIDGIGGRLYDGNISPGITSHVLASPVVWTNVTSVQMVYNDAAGNQYVMFWDRGSQPLEIISQHLTQGTVGNPYQQLLVVAGGMSPYSWSFLGGNLPAGVSFAPVTGELQGTPNTGGIYAFTARVTDRFGQTRERTFQLTINGGAPARLEPLTVASPGQFSLQLSVDAGRQYALQYSVDLANWFTLMTTNTVVNSIQLQDHSATNQARFYRTLLLP